MTIFKLFIDFLTVGLFSFGGGYSAIPLIKDLVLKNNWLTEEEYLNVVAVAESTPGPVLVNVSTYVGSILSGIIGCLIATLGSILPAFIIIIIFTKFFRKYLYTTKSKFLFSLIRPSICAVILAAGVELLFKNILMVYSIKEFIVFKNFFLLNNMVILKRVIICVLILLLMTIYKVITKKQLKSIPLIIISAFVGIIIM